MATFLVRQEYGISEGSKEEIGMEICLPLMTKLLNDLVQMRDWRKQVATTSRFYFTSESHLQSLMNLLERHLSLPREGSCNLNYCSQVVIKLFELNNLPLVRKSVFVVHYFQESPDRFEVEVWISGGADTLQPYNSSITEKALLATFKRLERVKKISLQELLQNFPEIHATGDHHKSIHPFWNP